MSKAEKGATRKRRSQVRTAEDLIEALGSGKNQVYEGLAAGKFEGAFRWGRKWIIPEATFQRLLGGGVTGKLNSTV